MWNQEKEDTDAGDGDPPTMADTSLLMERYRRMRLQARQRAVNGTANGYGNGDDEKEH